MTRKPFIRNGRLTAQAEAELSAMDNKKLGGQQKENALDALKAHNAGKTLNMKQAEASLAARSAVRKG